jgi:hypothetical protein
MCVSALVIVLRGKAILLGRPRGRREWLTKGGPPVWEAEEMNKNDTWLLPATHLIMKEAPDQAARKSCPSMGRTDGGTNVQSDSIASNLELEVKSKSLVPLFRIRVAWETDAKTEIMVV